MIAGGLIKLTGKINRAELVQKYPAGGTTLLVFPDNFPDSVLPYSALHKTNARGGLAQAMRPLLVQKEDGSIGYDLHCVGVPSMNRDTSVPNEQDIEKAFKRIFYLLGTGKYNSVAVPFRKKENSEDLEVSFRGGVAANDAKAQEMFNNYFNLLDEFLKDPSKISILPIALQNSYRAGEKYPKDPFIESLNDENVQNILREDYKDETYRSPATGFSSFSKKLNDDVEKLQKIKNDLQNNENEEVKKSGPPILLAKELENNPPASDSMVLTKDNYQYYQDKFLPDPIAALAQVIQDRSQISSDFKIQLRHIFPAVELATLGAVQFNKNTTTEENKNIVEIMKNIRDMFASIEILLADKSYYSKAQVEFHLLQLKVLLDKQKLSIDAKEKLLNSIKSVVEPNIFSQNVVNLKGITAFDAHTDSSDPKLSGFSKKVKIFHKKNADSSVTLTAEFSYRRSILLGTRVGKLWGSQQEELKEFRTQVANFVTVAITEYNKGSKENPINIKFGDTAKPEIALQILLEFKKRAIIEGKSFYVRHPSDGPIIEITSTSKFSEDEQKCFLHYAKANPAIEGLVYGSSVTKNIAVHTILKHDEEIGSLKNATDPQIVSAMSTYLDKEFGIHNKNRDERMKHIKGELEKPTPSPVPQKMGI